ncbi:MAG: hypothetical protein CMF51_05245 [Legionellales bacterium]|nr:hypothetical protein [Legionellales bacterium]
MLFEDDDNPSQNLFYSEVDSSQNLTSNQIPPVHLRATSLGSPNQSEKERSSGSSDLPVTPSVEL